MISMENKNAKDDSENEDSPLSRVLTGIQPFLWLGWVFVCSICLGILLGWWLDKKFGTKQVFTLIGGLLGITAGFVHFFKTVWKKK